jgi:PPP family 3-phenylpropionic acid transporter
VGFGQLGAWWGLRSLFPVYALLFVLALLASRHMVRREPAPPAADSGKVLDLLKDRPLARFMIVAGLAATGITVGYMFVYVFLGALGAGAALLGAVSAVGALAEVPAMRFSGKLIRKWGAPPVFAAGVLLFGLGWLFYATLQRPTLAPLIQILNGVGMGLMWPAGVTYVAGRTPAERGATAQSLFNAVMYGVAPLVASLFTGSLFDLAGARVVLLVAAAFMAASVLLFVSLRNLSPAEPDSMSAP